jgi:hypothetical protein
MIFPLNLMNIDDRKFKNICIKHINNGLLKGIDLALVQYKEVEDTYMYFRSFFPKGFYGDYVMELYRIRDILTSKMLYTLSDFDKYVVMCLLNNYYGTDVKPYSLKDSDILASHIDDKVQQMSSFMNYNVVKDEKNRKYLIEKIAIYSDELGVECEELMGTIEDLNQYIETCFNDIDFLNLGDFSIDEMLALSTIKEYKTFNICDLETKLYTPYVVIR